MRKERGRRNILSSGDKPKALSHCPKMKMNEGKMSQFQFYFPGQLVHTLSDAKKVLIKYVFCQTFNLSVLIITWTGLDI